MDIAILQTTVTNQFNAVMQTFSFDPVFYNSTAINDLLANVIATQSWNLTGVAAPPQLDSQHQTITVSGTCASFFQQTNAPLMMVFFLDTSGNAQLLIKLDLPGGWKFTTAFDMLQGTIFDDVAIVSGTVPKYVFASSVFTDRTLENGTFATGMNFYGIVAPSPTSQTFGHLMQVIGKFVNTTLVGSLNLYEGVPYMTLALGLQNKLDQYFPILSNYLRIQLVCRLDETTNEVGLLLETKFNFGTNQGLNLYTVLTPEPLGILTLTGEFKNVALPTPTQFAADFQKLIGGNDLYSSLPNQYQNSSNLYLKRITLGIGVSTLKPAIVSLEIGMPAGSPRWSLGDFATVSEVAFFASVQNPFEKNTRSIFVSVGGQLAFPTASQTIDLVLRGSATFTVNQSGIYALQAGLAPGSILTIPVGDLVNKYLLAGNSLPDMTFSQLGVDFRFQQPKNHYAFYAGLDKSHPLTFQFGGKTVFEVFYANLHVENDSNNGNPGGGLVGGIRIFSIQTDFVYQTPGNFKITAVIPEFDIDIAQIADGLLDTQWQLPSWMPVIQFPQTSLFIERQGTAASATYTFALLAQPSFGDVIVQVLKQESGWVFAGALALHSPKIAAFDSLKMLDGMDTMFKVNELLFVFTSATLNNGFQFPPKIDFQGGSGNNIALPTWSGQVKGGFYFYGSMKLNIESQPNLALVPKMFNLDADLMFQLLVFIGLDPTKDAYVQASVKGKINDTTTIQGFLGAKMEAGEPSFYLEGSISTQITDGSGKRSLLQGGIQFELTENAAFLSALMKGKVTFGPITLSNLVLVVGTDFEGIPSLGFAAQIDLSLYHTTFDSSIAFFFDSGNSSKSLFAGSISDITLKKIADTIVGEVTDGDQPPQWLDDLLAQVGVQGTGSFPLPASVATSLDDSDFSAITSAFNQAVPNSSYNFTQQSALLIVGKTDLDHPGVWYLTDLSGSNGAGNGVIVHYELKTQTDSSINVSLEPQFYYCMPPDGGSVTLGPKDAGLTFNAGVKLVGQFDFFMVHLRAELDIIPNKGFAADLLLVDPIILIKDYLEIIGNKDMTRGPQFSMSTYTVQRTDLQTGILVTLPPHFYLDGKIILLGLTVATTVNVSSAGVLIDFKASIGDASLGADMSVNTALNQTTEFSFEIAADVHINNPKFELFHTDLGTLSINLDISAGLTFGANANGLFFKIADTSFTIGSTHFTILGFDLDVTTQRLTDLPGIIYDEVKNLIWEFLRLAENWLEWVSEGLITGVEDLAKVLEDVYNMLSSVWANEKLVVVAVSESLIDSQSLTITLTPSQPGAGITQAMLDAAYAWAEQTGQFMVMQAIVKQLQQTPPENIGNFQVNVVQNLDETYYLQENINWFATPKSELPSLVSLGYQNPFADSRFYTQLTAQRKFQVNVCVDADFVKTVSRVTVTVRYNGVNVGTPHIFTSTAPYSFNANWDVAVADNYEVQYTVSFLNPQTPSLTSGWLKQKGLTLVLPISRSTVTASVIG
ncbi:hypothetical protein NIES4101_25970 (plasmid) [Calothrix sp. NIES-4101]|nr:hypothetical protein NIES4101_25970 [Calothrix sp. NIES-4101]